MDDVMKEYTPEQLRELSKQTDDLRAEMLFGLKDSGSDPYSEQFYLLALDAMGMAVRYMELAAMQQSKALAGSR